MEEEKRRTPQNCKSPKQRQTFITTVKNVTEKEKKKLKSLIRFHRGNKIDNYNREGKREEKEKKIQRNLQNKSKHKNNRGFS